MALNSGQSGRRKAGPNDFFFHNFAHHVHLSISTLLTFDYSHIDLPVKASLPEVLHNLEKGNTLILSAPPGAGKSTLLPLAFLGSPWLQGKKILMLEPRRLAAKSIASRMAELMGENVGETVGYRIRFEQRISDKTVIEVVTEGILTRMLQSDNALEEVGIVVFDEFHERSIHADLALALCRESQQLLRPDLKLLIMSATLDMPQLAALLEAPVVESKGRQYPVEVHYEGTQDLMLLPEMTAGTVGKVIKKHGGDVLVFLPGQGEIKKCEVLLRQQLSESNFSIHPLFGQLPYRQQRQALRPHPEGKRKIVLATSIAETSLTIEGVTVVVDSGFGRSSRFDPRSGLSRLVTVPISKDVADQRTGRAGRLSAGTCYRMWHRADQERLEAHRNPEIREADLTSLALDLAQWGIQDAMKLHWLTPPPGGTYAQARNTLHQLEALREEQITAHGRKMQSLPCHPRIAHLLLSAEEEQQLGVATDLAAILEERDPLPKDSGIDINLRIEALRRFRKGHGLGKGMKHIEKIASSYRKLFSIPAENGTVDPYATGFILARAYPERIGIARPGNNAQYQLANGKYAAASHRDDLAHEPFLAVAHVDAREGTGKIFMASPLNPQDLAPIVKTLEIITWDVKKGGLIANKELRIGSIVLQSAPIRDIDEEQKTEAICKALVKDGAHLLNFNDAVLQWQYRVLSLRQWQPEEDWPDVSTDALLRKADQWLSPYLNDIKKNEDLKKIDLIEVLHHHLPWEKQKELDRLAPARMEVPSGSQIKIEYRDQGAVPILAVRLQEVFGLETTPTVNEGHTKLLMHLLSPGYKPVQITDDLENFWKNTYYEVRKDLKGRYPKHAWPDDPNTAQAIRGAKRRKPS